MGTYLSPPQRLLQRRNGEKTGKEREYGEIKKSGVCGGCPQSTGKTKETSAEERGHIHVYIHQVAQFTEGRHSRRESWNFWKISLVTEEPWSFRFFAMYCLEVTTKN